MIPAIASIEDPTSRNTASVYFFSLCSRPDLTCPIPTRNISRAAYAVDPNILEVEFLSCSPTIFSVASRSSQANF